MSGHGIERRAIAAGEMRLEDGRKLRGHAAVFNVETVIGPWFREVILPGFFAPAIEGKQDAVATLNHDNSTAFARVAAGTLRLVEDERGLAIEADLDPADPDVQRLAAKIGNGTWSEMSFAFTSREEQWDESEVKNGKLPLRRLAKIDRLYDVAVVTFPAYPNTDASVRSAEQVLRDYRTEVDRQEPAATDNPQPPVEQEPAEVLHRLLDLAEV